MLRTFQNAYIVTPEDGRKWAGHVGINNITAVLCILCFRTVLVLALQFNRIYV